MNLMRIIFFMLMICFCASCSEVTRPDLGEEITLEFGQIATLRGRDLSVKFERLMADSRCPTGAVCVWEGNAEILLRVISGDLVEVYSINTTLEPKQVEQDGYHLELISVSPYPDLSDELTEDEYSITITVTH
jgi:hypothetical protein